MCTHCSNTLFPGTPSAASLRPASIRGYHVAGDSIGEGLYQHSGQAWGGARGAPIAFAASQLRNKVPEGARVILTMGTNDARAGLSNERIKENLDNVIAAARERGQRIEHIVGPVKPNPGAVDQAFARNLTRVNDVMREHLAMRGIGYVDLHRPENRLAMSGYHPTFQSQGYGKLVGIIANSSSTTALTQMRVQGRPQVASALPPAYPAHQAPVYIAPVAAATQTRPSHFFYNPQMRYAG